MKKKRNRSRPVLSLQERLKQVASLARAKADGLPPGQERDRLIQTAVTLQPRSTGGWHPRNCAARSSRPFSLQNSPKPSLGFFGVQVDDVQPVREFVGHFHSPILAGTQPAIEVLNDLRCRHRRLVPRGLRIRQFFPLLVQFSPVVVLI